MAVTTITYVQTVLGGTYRAQYNYSRAYGDLAQLTAPTTPYAYAMGCAFPEDGGGGLFQWEPGVTTGDDGGTMIVNAAGRWRRVFSGALNVRWFGAHPLWGDVRHQLQRAIDAAARASYTPGSPLSTLSEVYIPEGEYTTYGPLVVPRLPQNVGYLRGITIRGDGPSTSAIVARPDAAGVAPSAVLRFDDVDAMTYCFRLEDLKLGRSVPGCVFSFVGGDGGRLVSSRFRNLILISPDPFGGPWHADNAVQLTHVHDSVFEDVRIMGGYWSIEARDCSRLTFDNTWIGFQYTGASQHGVNVVGGGSHLFRRTRIESPGSASSLGEGVRIDGASGVTLTGTTFEDHGTMSAHLRLVGHSRTSNVGTFDIDVEQLSGGSAHEEGHVVSIGPGVHDVRFRGGRWSGIGAIVHLEGATETLDAPCDVQFDDVLIAQSNAPEQMISIAPDCQRIRAPFRYLVWEPQLGRTVRRVLDASAGWTSDVVLTPVNGEASVRGWDVWSAREWPEDTVLHTLLHGFSGQTVTLLCDGSVALDGDEGNLRLVGDRFAPAHGGTIRLVYDAGCWTELSRAELS